MSTQIILNSHELSFIFWLSAFSFVLAIILTPVLTYFLFKYRVWKQAKTQAVTGEKAKVFTLLHGEKLKRKIPTMAGILIWGVVLIVTLLFNLDRGQTWLPLFAMVSAGLLGFVDDYINIRATSPGIKGINAGMKMFWLIVISGIGAWWFSIRLGYSELLIPGLGSFDIGYGYIPLFMFLTISTANAVNITDGLDGLAGGLVAITFLAFAGIALTQGHLALAAFCGTVVGATLAYTWFNIYPARFFMGDTGSLALGATLGVVTALTQTEILLPIIGGVFVVEAASSLIQISSKKIFGRKVFRIAPLHHHLEAIGWPETKVTMRLWVIGAVLAIIGMVLALMQKSILFI